MRVAVTGASGGVGEAVVRRLLRDRGREVVAVDRAPPRPVRGDGPRAHAVVADLRETALEAALPFAVDAVVHCAARIPGPGADDAACAADNRRIDDRVLQSCAAHRRPVIFLSTAAVFPRRVDGSWQDEGTSVEPAGAYAAAKLESERRFLALPAPGAVILRLTSPYGPGQQATTVLRRFCGAAIRGEPVEVWGSGRREQDFVHVDDVAEAVALALGAPAFPAGILVLGAGRPTSMIDLAREALRAAGRGGEPRTGGRPDPDEGRTARYAIGRARAVLGWEPRIALTDGIASCVRAWREAP